MKKILTAYNQEVQRYIRDHAMKPTAAIVGERLEVLEASVYEQCGIFAKLFPGKRSKVLNEIVFATSGCGVWKIGAATLARKADCSERTVYAAVNALKKTGEFIVARLADGHAGHYVFVDKRSERFGDIMHELFSLSTSEIAGLVAGLVAGLENAETVDTTSVEGEKQGSNYIKSLNKPLKDFNIYNKLGITQDTREGFMSEWQKSLYALVKPLIKKTQDNDVQKSILAMEIKDAKQFVKAKNVLLTTLSDIMNGTLTITKSLRASVVAAYQKAIERSPIKKYVAPTYDANAEDYELFDWLNASNFEVPEAELPENDMYNWLLD